MHIYLRFVLVSFELCKLTVAYVHACTVHFSVPVKTVVHEAISRDRSRKNLERMVSKQQLAVGEPPPP